jgi:uncharacterized protein (DUF1800 family)
MELHTLGVDGGYTQNDVINVAKCFTGWTYYSSTSGTDSYRFRFRSDRHAAGNKVVLGQNITGQTGAAGQAGGGAGSRHPHQSPQHGPVHRQEASEAILGYEPPQSHINAVAAAYSSSGGDIKSMLRVVFGLVIAKAPPLKLKRPLHLLISAMRAAQATVTSHTNFPASVQTPLVQAGHLPFNWQSPMDIRIRWTTGWAASSRAGNVGATLMNGSSGSGYSGLSS